MDMPKPARWITASQRPPQGGASVIAIWGADEEARKVAENAAAPFGMVYVSEYIAGHIALHVNPCYNTADVLAYLNSLKPPQKGEQTAPAPSKLVLVKRADHHASFGVGKGSLEIWAATPEAQAWVNETAPHFGKYSPPGEIFNPRADGSRLYVKPMFTEDEVITYLESYGSQRPETPGEAETEAVYPAFASISPAFKSLKWYVTGGADYHALIGGGLLKLRVFKENGKYRGEVFGYDASYLTEQAHDDIDMTVGDVIRLARALLYDTGSEVNRR